MLEEFTGFIHHEQLFQKGQPVLLAISGGIDSTVMAHLFHQARYPFGIAHCNFKLRGSESDEDEQFVIRLAEQYKVQCFITHFETKEITGSSAGSTQMVARRLRYDWLEKIRKENGFHFIATAHHQNDVVETMLINLVKGTGISGLHGILSKKEKIIRPLLFANREAIARYAEQSGLAYRTDSSNISEKYLRNKIRLKVVPVLKEINPSLEKTFSENAQRLRDCELLYNYALERLKKKLMEQRGEDIYIPFNKFLNYPAPQTLLFEILKAFNFNRHQSAQIFQNLDSEPGQQFFSDTHRVIKDRKFLIIAGKDSGNATYLLIEAGKKEVKLKELWLSIRTLPPFKYKPAKNEKTAYLDRSKLEFPLVLRRWKEGDYFYPLGMGHKKKKLKKFFSDLKLSLIDKEKVWVLQSGEKIAWVVGYRVDERFRVTDKTKEVLKISQNRP